MARVRQNANRLADWPGQVSPQVTGEGAHLTERALRQQAPSSGSFGPTFSPLAGRRIRRAATTQFDARIGAPTGAAGTLAEHAVVHFHLMLWERLHSARAVEGADLLGESSRGVNPPVQARCATVQTDLPT